MKLSAEERQRISEEILLKALAVPNGDNARAAAVFIEALQRLGKCPRDAAEVLGTSRNDYADYDRRITPAWEEAERKRKAAGEDEDEW